MFKITIRLLIFSINYNEHNKYILSNTKDLLEIPSFELQQNLETELKDFFLQKTGFGLAWSQIKIVDCHTHDKNLNIVYLIKIPYDSIIDGAWIKTSIASAIEPDIEIYALHV